MHVIDALGPLPTFTIPMRSWPLVTCALGLFGVLAYAADTHLIEYSVFHRVLEYTDASSISGPWSPRALIQVPEILEAGPQVKYHGVDGSLNFEQASPNALYQVKLVAGNVFELPNKEYESALSRDDGFVAYTKLCQLQVQQEGLSLPDAFKLHMMRIPSNTGTKLAIAGVVYAVEQDADMDMNACPIFPDKNMHAVYASSFHTELRLMLPETLSGHVHVPNTNESTQSTGKDRKGSKNTREQPKNLLEFLQRYWIYLLPLLILFVMPAAEEPPAPPSSDSTVGHRQQGRIQPGPAAKASGTGKRD